MLNAVMCCRYISGENAAQQTIEMTVPVMNRMVETQVNIDLPSSRYLSNY